MQSFRRFVSDFVKTILDSYITILQTQIQRSTLRGLLTPKTFSPFAMDRHISSASHDLPTFGAPAKIYRPCASKLSTTNSIGLYTVVMISSQEGEKTWNPETHQVDQADGKWTSDTKAITVTNHSNVGIMAKFNFASEGDIEGSFTKDGTSTDKLALDTIKNLDEGSATPSDTMNFGITGGAISENCKLGTITVYITPNDNSNYIFTEAELTEAAVKNAQ